MSKKPNNDPIDTLGAAYEKMYERAVENLHKAKDTSTPLLHKFIDDAKLKAIELEELAKDDASKIAEWLKRDLNDKVNYLVSEENELKDWLGFETSLLESAVLDLMLKTADKTTLELLKMKNMTHQSPNYKSGEITGPGTLKCVECDEKIHFHKAGRIPSCPNCHATIFTR